MKRALIALAFLLCAAPGFAQVAVDNSFSAASLTGSSHTLSVTIAANSNRALYFCSGYNDNTPATKITGATLGGSQNFVRVTGDGEDTGIVQSEMWRLLAPATGTANIVVSFTGAENGSLGALTVYNVDQTTPERNVTHTNGGAATATGTATSVSGDLTFSCVTVKSSSSAPTGSETERFEVALDGSRRTAGETLQATTTSTSVGFTFAGAANYAQSTATIAQVAAGGPATGSLMMMGVGK